MTTYLSKNELSYDIDFGTDDDCLEVAQLFDEASEGLVKYYHDDIFNISHASFLVIGFSASNRDITFLMLVSVRFS